MIKIEIEEMRFLAEINWTNINEGQKISEYLNESDKTDKKGFIIKSPVKGEGDSILGLFGDEKIGNLQSILGIMISANRKLNKDLEKDGHLIIKNWICLLNIDGSDKYWTCIIKDGMPYLHYITDRVLKIDDIFNNIIDVSQLTNSNSETESEFNLVTNEDSEKISSLASDIGLNITHVNLVDLVKKNKSVAKLKKLKPNKILPILIILTLVGGYFLYDYQQKIEEEEAIARNLLQQQREEEQKMNQIKKYIVEYEIAKKESINNSIKNAENNLNELLSNNQVIPVLNGWLNILNNIPLDHVGWKLTTINCSIMDFIPYCDVYLQRETFGINKLLLKKYGHLDLNINGNVASYKLKSKEIKSIKVNYKNLESDKYFVKNIMSNFEIMNIAEVNYNIGERSDITYPIMLPSPPLGVEQNTDIEPINMGVSKGNYDLEGTDLWKIKGLIPYLKDNSLSVNNLNIDFSNDITQPNWKLSGEYYIKTNNEIKLPFIPEATIGLGNNSSEFNQ